MMNNGEKDKKYIENSEKVEKFNRYKDNKMFINNVYKYVMYKNKVNKKV